MAGIARILGVDPGVSETGWAVIESASGVAEKLLGCGLIRTKPSQILSERLREIHGHLSEVILEYEPDSVAVEEMFFLKAAHTIRGTLQARGVILLAAAQANKAISEYNPRAVKIALSGSGEAPKAQMQKAVQRALNLGEALRPDDVADAAAIALCHLRSGRIGKLKVVGRIGGGGPRRAMRGPIPRAGRAP